MFDRCAQVATSPDNHLDLWAREHYKSTIITFGKTIQDILITHGDDAVGKECTIGLFSHTRPNAKGFLRQIKREFEQNELLNELFPDIFWKDTRHAPKWSEDDGIIVRRKSNPKEATIEAWGVVDGQPIGKHFSHLIYDDIVTAETVTTPEMILKTTDMLALSYSLGSEGGVRRFIGTRYHRQDTYATIMERKTVEPRIHPATIDGTIEGEPVLLTRERLAKKRKDMGDYIFQCQMMQNPISEHDQVFLAAWKRTYVNPPGPGRNADYILLDPAGSKKKGSDNTAGWVVRLGEDKNIYILDGVRDKLSLTQRADTVFNWHKAYNVNRATGVRYEKYGKDSDIEHMESKMNEEGYRFSITAVGGITPKNERIRRLIPYFQQGRIWFPETLWKTGYDGKPYDLVDCFFKDEFEDFPMSAHDDMLDALARLLEPDFPLSWPAPDERLRHKISTRKVLTTTSNIHRNKVKLGRTS